MKTAAYKLRERERGTERDREREREMLFVSLLRFELTNKYIYAFCLFCFCLGWLVGWLVGTGLLVCLLVHLKAVTSKHCFA